MRHLVFTPDGTIRAGGAETVGSLAQAVRVAQSVEDGGWTLEAAIPFAALGFDGPPEGETWRMNVGRVDAAGAATSAAPVVGTLADRARFMEVRFRADAPHIRIGGLADIGTHRQNLDVEARSADPEVRLDYIFVRDDINDRLEGWETRRGRLFEDGRSTPLRSPADPRLLREFQVKDLQIVELRDGVETPVFRKRLKSLDERLPMKTRFFYTLDRSRLSVSAERRADGRIQARFLDGAEGGTEVWRARQPIPATAMYFEAVFDLDFDVLSPGLYTVKIDHVAPDGTETETFSQAYRIPAPDAPEFTPYVDKEADLVPAPWTPVEVSGFGVQGSGDGEHRTEASTVDVQPSSFNLHPSSFNLHPSSFQISTWGRTYGFGEGILFDALVSQGEALLAAPVRLLLDGEALSLVSPSAWTPGEATDMAATLTQRADLGVLTAESRIVTHFDGYCDIALTLTPHDGPLEIQTLALEFPLVGDAARLVRDGLIAPLTGSKSGALGDAWDQRLMGGPSFWVGNDRVGFNWVADSMETWHARSQDSHVEMTREGDVMRVRLNLVTLPLRLDRARTFSFGLTLTPTRPLDRRILRRRESKDYASMAQPWKYFAVFDYDTANPEPLRNALRRAEPDATQVFLYGGDAGMSPFHPSWGFFEQEWRAVTPTQNFGEWIGGFTDPVVKKAAHYAGACRGSPTYRNFVDWMYHDFFERVAQSGPMLLPEATAYYFDTGIGMPSRCENPHHGCHLWETVDGHHFGRLFLNETRAMWLNLYRMIRRSGPEAMVYYHQGWLRVMPAMTFTDIICGGEGIKGQTIQPDGTYNYYDFFTPELFRATFSPYIWGVKMVFIDQQLRLLLQGNQAAYAALDLDNPDHRRPLMHSYGYCLVHDVDVWDRDLHSLPLRRAIWAAQDALGWDEDVIFHPYWENDAIKRLGDDIDRIMASAYTKNGRMLLVVFNDTDEDREVELALDLAALGVDAEAAGQDVFDPERLDRLGVRWTGKVPRREFRLILWE